MYGNRTDSTLTPPRKLEDPDEDILCIDCGYSLKFPSADPVRCPECGATRKLEDLRVPADAVAASLRRLESLLTLSVAGAWATILGAFVFYRGHQAAVLGLGSIFCIVPAVWFGKAAGFDRGWWRVLIWYQATGVVWLGLLVAVGLTSAWAWNFLSAPVRILVCCVGVIAPLVFWKPLRPPCLSWIGAPYRRARLLLNTTCHRSATAMAYRRLHPVEKRSQESDSEDPPGSALGQPGADDKLALDDAGSRRRRKPGETGN
jgi:hypothetical protein